MTDATAGRSRLEQALADRGFVRAPGVGYLAWQGTVGERQCTVSVAGITRTSYPLGFRRRDLVGYRLSVELATTVRIRLFVMRASTASNLLMRWLHRVNGFSVIHPASVPSGFCVVTNDAEWAGRFCQQAHGQGTLAALMGEGLAPEAQASVYFRVNSSTGLACYGGPTATNDVESAQLDRIFAGLTALADAAEGLPAPARPVRIGRWGRFTERHPEVAVVGVFFGAIAVLGFVALGIVAVIVLMVWLLA